MLTHRKTSTQLLIKKIRESVVGNDHKIDGPFGAKPIVYADYTASGRALGFIEDYISQEVLPFYANTHTESSGTGLATTRLREQARAIIKNSVGANELDAAIFCGAGMTGAVNHLITVLGLNIPNILDKKYKLSSHIPDADRPVVFIGPYEHHSNELPWRETIADVITIQQTNNGMIDAEQLKSELDKFRHRPLKIGSFSAASNVTGICSDVDGITALLHEFGALAFWDYAAAAPYVGIDMNPEPDRALAKDAIFISPHKLIGGPGTPGLLIIKKELLKNEVPAQPGGGTVSYVNPDDHSYLSDMETREEGGTPAIIESIRAGLVFQLKDAVGSKNIESLDEGFKQRAIISWGQNPNIDILGELNAPRLAIISFIIRCGDKSLHHDFVVKLLNDLFGIQARGGCSCAGPYGHRLLNINIDRSRDFEKVVACGDSGLKPGWVRIGFNYFFDQESVDYIIEAVNLIALDGWKLLPFYTFDEQTGIWQHIHGKELELPGIDQISYNDGKMNWVSHKNTKPESSFGDLLATARKTFTDAHKVVSKITPQKTVLSKKSEALRWFCIPEDGAIEPDQTANL